MGYCMPIGTSAAFSNSSLDCTPIRPSFSSCRVGQEEVTDRLQIVSFGKGWKVQSGQEAGFRGLRRNRGGRERSLEQQSTGIGSVLRHEIYCRFPLASRYGGVRTLRRRSGSKSEGVPVCNYGEDREVSDELIAAASGESEAEGTRVTLSPNLSSSEDDKRRIFIFGFGYTSCALASYLKNSWRVSGTCRSEEKKLALEQYGYSAHVFNSDNDGEELREEGLLELQQASHWLISVPPVADFDTDPVLTSHLQDLNQAVKKGNVGWIGYLSSTGVYGDWQGDWVDEESQPRPVEQRALARLMAEDSWLKFGLENAVPVHIFRLGGIYGPGRSAMDTILQNRTLSARQHSREQRRFTSRIHVADVCQTVLASMQNPDSGKVYNLVDDDPAPRLEVLAYALDLLQNWDDGSHFLFTEKSSPPKMALGGSKFSNEKGEKRVLNKRIKLDLKVRLRYPTYRQGLKAILDASKK